MRHTTCDAISTLKVVFAMFNIVEILSSCTFVFGEIQISLIKNLVAVVK